MIFGMCMTIILFAYLIDEKLVDYDETCGGLNMCPCDDEWYETGCSGNKTDDPDTPS